MNPQQAKQTVLVAMITLIGISIYRQKADPGTLYKRVWGTGVLGLFLSLISDFAPAIAGPFAILTVLGALTHGGDKALVNLFGSGAGGPGTGSSTKAPAAQAPTPPVTVPPQHGQTGPVTPAAPQQPQTTRHQ